MKWRSLEESNRSTDPRPLREIYAERKDLIAKYLPTETQKVHADAVAELKQRNLAANILPVRAMAPEFELHDHDGELVRSVDLLAKSHLSSASSAAAGGSFCVGQMEAMNRIVQQIERLDTGD